MHKYISLQYILYNVYSYTFLHLYVILREFYICASKLHKVLKLKQLKSQFHKVIDVY
jgi:hypothetical protein